MSTSKRIPRDKENDYSREMAAQRAAFVAEMTGASLNTVASYTIDPTVTRGNIENFVGTAQVPLGIAGPLTIVGEGLPVLDGGGQEILNISGKAGEVLRVGIAFDGVTTAGHEQDFKVYWPSGLMFSDPTTLTPFVLGE